MCCNSIERTDVKIYLDDRDFQTLRVKVNYLLEFEDPDIPTEYEIFRMGLPCYILNYGKYPYYSNILDRLYKEFPEIEGTVFVQNGNLSITLTWNYEDPGDEVLSRVCEIIWNTLKEKESDLPVIPAGQPEDLCDRFQVFREENVVEVIEGDMEV